MDCSTSAFSILHHLLEFAQIHVHWVGDAVEEVTELEIFLHQEIQKILRNIKDVLNLQPSFSPPLPQYKWISNQKPKDF